METIKKEEEQPSAQGQERKKIAMRRRYVISDRGGFFGRRGLKRSRSMPGKKVHRHKAREKGAVEGI